MRCMRPNCWVAEFRIETDRLVLREWRESDLLPFHEMYRDAGVMEFLGPTLELPESINQVAQVIERLQTTQNDHGCCFWALERREDSEFVGFCGVKPGPSDTPIEGRLEIGWRLARAHWGQGYAFEAAKASIEWAFGNRSDESVWAITVLANVRSWGLMERLGMVRHPELDFDHPNVPAGSPLTQHIVYSISK
jgi:RimJ/RimL family protein N-acetyltransferase